MHDPGGKSKPKWPEDSTIKATFSECGTYRYSLQETWDIMLPTVMFLMMNPSVATTDFADPTLNKTGNYARKWGYGSQYVSNVCAYRSTDKFRLLSAEDPVGPKNWNHILYMAHICDIIVLAHGVLPGRLKTIATKMVSDLAAQYPDKLHYITKSANGTPNHPLYLKGNARPWPYLAETRPVSDKR